MLRKRRSADRYRSSRCSKVMRLSEDAPARQAPGGSMPRSEDCDGSAGRLTNSYAAIRKLHRASGM